jgi:hypothetical protein
MRVAWQVFVALLIATGLFFIVASLVNIHDAGEFGFTAGEGNGAGLRLGSVTPGSPTAQAGLTAGEWIYPEPSLQARVITYSSRPGERLTMHVGRPDGPTVTLIATEVTPPPMVLIAILVLTRLAFLLVAGIVAWRRPQDPAARALATFLAAYGVGLAIDFGIFADTTLRFASLVLDETLFLIGGVAVLAFACRFPAPKPGGFRERLARAVPAIAAVGFALSWARIFGAFAFGTAGLRPLLAAYVVWYSLVLLLALGSFVGSYRSASGPERVRMSWILTTFGVGFCGLIAFLVAVGVGFPTTWTQYLGLTVMFIPIGLGYTILRHRVLDIGFVINRAVVYTSVSFVVVGAFITFEWLLGHLVDQGSRASVVLQLGGALALGLSVRFIHTRVDRYVDDIFFRERHAAEAAMRRFAREAALITTPQELVTKTVEVAQSRARLSGCAFYVREGAAYAPLQSTIPAAEPVGENDYAILEMRTWHAAVDPHESASALRGELALPMMVRGSLSGFLLCGAKETHEAFAPDERDALGVLARDAGLALDSLRVRIIERELVSLAGDGALPDDLRARLSEIVARTGGS